MSNLMSNYATVVTYYYSIIDNMEREYNRNGISEQDISQNFNNTLLIVGEELNELIFAVYTDDRPNIVEEVGDVIICLYRLYYSKWGSLLSFINSKDFNLGGLCNQYIDKDSVMPCLLSMQKLIFKVARGYSCEEASVLVKSSFKSLIGVIFSIIDSNNILISELNNTISFKVRRIAKLYRSGEMK